MLNVIVKYFFIINLFLISFINCVLPDKQHEERAYQLLKPVLIYFNNNSGMYHSGKKSFEVDFECVSKDFDKQKLHEYFVYYLRSFLEKQVIVKIQNIVNLASDISAVRYLAVDFDKRKLIFSSERLF